MELDWLKRWNLYSPQSIAIKDGETGAQLSYGEFYQAANRAASFLQKTYQIGAGDRVAVLATNELDYVVLFFALQRLDAILVPINFRLTQREVDHIVTDCEPKLIVSQEAFRGVIENLPALKQPLPHLMFDGKGSFAEKVQVTAFFEVPYRASEESTTMIIYTSGTTGAPKGAMISHRMIFWNSINTTIRLNISQSDCTVSFLPFFHTGGWNVLTTPILHRGGKIVFLKKFDADQILAMSEKEKATILFGVPTTMDLMAHSPLFSDVSLKNIRYAIVGGEPMPLELIKTWDRKGIPVRQGFGLTEFGPGVFSLNEEHAMKKIGSIGFPNFYVEAKIIDEKGSELADDQIGELLLKGPSCMTGYWNNPQATAETIQGGWLHTGDLVRRDPEGFYYMVGRKKEMFKSGGENVYPAELEQVLRTCAGVREVAIIGVADEKWGEVGKAFVVRSAASLTEENLREHCLKNLAKFKIPKYFTFLESLPKGDSGKILKRKLHDL